MTANKMSGEVLREARYVESLTMGEIFLWSGVPHMRVGMLMRKEPPNCVGTLDLTTGIPTGMNIKQLITPLAEVTLIRQGNTNVPFSKYPDYESQTNDPESETTNTDPV